jgi:hypothetical protein
LINHLNASQNNLEDVYIGYKDDVRTEQLTMRFFISYSRRDYPFARGLYESLTGAGQDPWLDLIDIAPGSDWWEAITRGIGNAEYFLLITTPWSMGSYNVRREWQLARSLGKPVLMIILQSVGEDDLAAAAAVADPLLPAETSPVSLLELTWVDVRSKPTQACEEVLAWVTDPSSANSGTLPFPPEHRRNYREYIPSIVSHVARYLMISSVALVIATLIAVARMVYLHIDQATAMPAILKLLLSVALMLTLVTSLIIVENMGSTINIYTRRSANLADNLHLYAVSLRALGFASLILRLPFIIAINGSQASTLDRIGNVYEIALIGVMLLLSAFYEYLSRQLKRSVDFQLWSPAYPQDLVSSKPATRSPTVAQPPSQIRPGLLPFKMVKPATHVSIIFSPRDAPFARELRGILRTKRITASMNQIDAALDDASIIVVSPYLEEDTQAIACWFRAQESGIPVAPVLLEGTTVSSSIGRLNWIDAREGTDQAYQILVSMLLGEEVLVNARPPEKAPSPLTETHRWLAPDKVFKDLQFVIASQVARLIFVELLLPFAFIVNPRLHLDGQYFWGILAIFGYVQLMITDAYLRRRASRLLMIGIQVISIVLWYKSIGPITSVVSHSFLEQGNNFVAYAITALIFVDLFALAKILALHGYHRPWALAKGFRPAKQGLVSAFVFMALLAVAGFTPVFALLSHDIALEGGFLEKDQPALALVEAPSDRHVWTFNAAKGESVIVDLVDLSSVSLESSLRLSTEESDLKLEEENQLTIAGRRYIYLATDDGSHTISVERQRGNHLYCLTIERQQ